jgi:hypothetical protein
MVPKMAIRNESPPAEEDGVTDLQERVLILLEQADIPTPVCDSIMALIAKAEAESIAGRVVRSLPRLKRK